MAVELHPATLPQAPVNEDKPLWGNPCLDEMLEKRMDSSRAPTENAQMEENDRGNQGDPIPITLTPNPEEVICGPMEYLLSTHGKSFRDKLIAGFSQFLEVPKHKVNVISRVVELLHTASLLIDDIQDGSTLRRGLPVAHSIFGVAQTINSANYAYFLAQKHLEDMETPEAYTI